MLTFLFDKTRDFFRKLTFLHQPDALVRFFTSFKQTFISENSTKHQRSSFSDHPILPTAFEAPSSHIVIHTMLKDLWSTSHSYFIYKLRCLYFCSILCPKRSTIEMTSLNQITLLHSHMYIHIFR